MSETPAMLLGDGIVLLAWATAVYLVYSLATLLQLSLRAASRNEALVYQAEDVNPVAIMSGADALALQDSLAAELPPASPTLKLSPRYEVALSLAFQGFDIAAVARRCDISVAEAKLVAELAQSYQGLQQSSGEPHGGRARAAA